MIISPTSGMSSLGDDQGDNNNNQEETKTTSGSDEDEDNNGDDIHLDKLDEKTNMLCVMIYKTGIY